VEGCFRNVIMRVAGSHRGEFDISKLSDSDFIERYKTLVALIGRISVSFWLNELKPILDRYKEELDVRLKSASFSELYVACFPVYAYFPM